MDAAPAKTPIQSYAPELSRRVVNLVGALRMVIFHGFLQQRDLIPLAEPLLKRISGALRRFQTLMVLFAAGYLPRQRRGPHTGGAPHPENLQRGNPVPTTCGWLEDVLGREAADLGTQLEKLLAAPAAVELLARVPAAERALRPLRRLFGRGPFDVILNRRTDASIRPLAGTRPSIRTVARPWRPPDLTLRPASDYVRRPAGEPELPAPDYVRYRLILPPSKKPP